MTKETVFLIHGTFSGGRSPKGTAEDKLKWWESGSRSWNDLRDLLAAAGDRDRFELTDRFVWGDGGKNSETLRRQGGKDLFEELKALETAKEKPSYHLVAHSHGGSVIWHALVEAKLRKLELTGLKSWTTVGTPFLKFTPSDATLWLLAPLAVSLLALIWFGLVWPMPIAAFGNAWTWSGQPIALVGLLLTIAILGISLVAAASLLIAQVVEVVRDRRRGIAESEAIATYGPLHFALTHEDDEPTNGIGLSTYQPGHIWPRPKLDDSRGPLRKALTWASRAVSEIWARPIDDLAWRALARQVQGDDHPRLDLGAVSTAPYGAADTLANYDTTEGSTIGTKADENAMHIGHRIRDLLQTIAGKPDAAIELSVIGEAIDWRGIIHTSYFDHPFTMQRIARRLLKPEPQRVNATEIKVSRYWPRSLTVAMGVASAGALGLVALIAALLGETWLMPYTEQRLFATVADLASEDPLVSKAGNTDLPGHLALRLYRLAEMRLTPPTRSVTIEPASQDFNTLMRSAQVRAYWLASPQGANSLTAVDDYAKTFPGDDSDKLLTSYYLQSAAIWSRLRGAAPKDEEAKELWRRSDEILPQSSVDIGQGQKIVQSLVRIFLGEQIGQPDAELPPTLSQLQACRRAREVALALIDIAEPRRAAELAANCTPGKLAEANLLLIGHLHGRYPVGDYLRLLAQVRVDDESAAEVFDDRPTIECIMQIDNLTRFGLLRRQLLDVAHKLFIENKPDDAATALSTMLVWAEQTPLWAENLLALGDATPMGVKPAIEAQYAQLVESLFQHDVGTLAQITKRVMAKYPDLKLEIALVPALRKEEDLAKNSGPSFVELAKSFVSEGGEAVEHLNKALATMPTYNELAGALGLSVADEALRLNDTALWAKAIDLSRDPVFGTQRSERRLEMMRRLAKAEVRRGNFPEALRIVGFVDNADDRVRGLIAVADALLCHIGDATSCGATAFPLPSEIPTDWVNEPDDIDDPVMPTRPFNLKQCDVPPEMPL